jgi:serine/threonine-protein kinase
MDPQSGAAQTDPLIGQTVGNYLVTQKLGEGGMGAVYLAEHPTISKKVALKVLHPEFSGNPEVAERFFTEAKAVNAINHPNIVDIVDYGVIQSAGGRERMVYFIMEFLSGTTLADVIRTDSPVTPERSLTIALQVADALAASHRTGIVHRDLKPDNIILVRRGRERDFVKLLDFGIAKLTGTDGVSSHKTQTGLVLGTPAYMSPEQCEGKANVDHRTDVYALGIVLYEMLVGRVPFIGEGYGEILVQHLTTKPAALSTYRMLSPHVEAVVMKALEKRPEMRYPTMDEFIRAMSDPVAYVEANGGVAGFAQRMLTVSTEEMPPVRLNTPVPGTQLTGVRSAGTPAPGTLSPVPGTIAPSPTTLTSASGQLEGGARSKTGFVIGGAAVVVIAAVAVFFAARGGKDKDSGTGSGSGEVASPVAANPTEHAKAAGSAASVDPPKQTGSVAPTGSASTADLKVPVSPDVQLMQLTLTSNPPGAEIFYNGGDLHKQTPTVLKMPLTHDKGEFRLRLKGYDEYVIKDVPFDGDLEQSATLKKMASVSAGHSVGHGAGSSAHSNTGSHNDTGLMAPE